MHYLALEIFLVIYLIEMDKENPTLYYNRGVVFYHTGESDCALKDFNKAIDIDNFDPNYYFNRGNTYLAIDNYPKAYQDFEKAISLAPNNAKFYHSGRFFNKTDNVLACFFVVKYDRQYFAI